jgi:hypothetical protein
MGAHEPRRYHSISAVYGDIRTQPAASDDEVQAEIRDAVLDSVRQHLVADVPVGAFLSAGIDSGALIGLMRDSGQQDIQTVTLAFSEFWRGLDEAPLADQVARIYGARSTTRLVTQANSRPICRTLEAMDRQHRWHRPGSSPAGAGGAQSCHIRPLAATNFSAAIPRSATSRAGDFRAALKIPFGEAARTAARPVDRRSGLEPERDAGIVAARRRYTARPVLLGAGDVRSDVVDLGLRRPSAATRSGWLARSEPPRQDRHARSIALCATSSCATPTGMAHTGARASGRQRAAGQDRGDEQGAARLGNGIKAHLARAQDADA